LRRLTVRIPIGIAALSLFLSQLWHSSSAVLTALSHFWLMQSRKCARQESKAKY
jgi:hypothetical protein